MKLEGHSVFEQVREVGILTSARWTWLRLEYVEWYEKGSMCKEPAVRESKACRGNLARTSMEGKIIGSVCGMVGFSAAVTCKA